MRLDADGAEAGRELDVPHAAALEHDAGHHRADEDLNAGRFDLRSIQRASRTSSY